MEAILVIGILCIPPYFMAKKDVDAYFTLATLFSFFFGVIFIGLSGPAKDAPSGLPLLAYCGIILLIYGFLIAIITLLFANIKFLNKKKEIGLLCKIRKKYSLGKMAFFGAIIILILGICILIGAIHLPSSSYDLHNDDGTLNYEYLHDMDQWFQNR